MSSSKLLETSSFPYTLMKTPRSSIAGSQDTSPNSGCPCLTRRGFRDKSEPGAPRRYSAISHLFTLLDVCVSSFPRGHANLLCTVQFLTDDPRRESESSASYSAISHALVAARARLLALVKRARLRKRTMADRCSTGRRAFPAYAHVRRCLGFSVTRSSLWRLC